MRFPLFDADLATQASGARASVPPRGNGIYVMLKASPALVRHVWDFEETARSRPPELLHMTIQPVGDRSWITDADIEATCAALSRLRYAPFVMQFDRIEGGETMSLSGGTRNYIAQDFRLAILDALFTHYERLPSYRLDPHMTLDYRGHPRGRLLDRPIAWMIEDFSLIESVHGETRHIELGRWQLRED